MTTPISVSAGFGWTAAGAWLGGLSAFIGLVALIIRQIGPWRRQTTEAETRLREGLERRVKKLERIIDRTHARHEAERALDRHKFSNIAQCFDAVMLMLEAAPDKAPEIVARIKEMRRAQIEAEVIEKAAIHAAEIAAAAEDEEEDAQQ